MIRKLKNRFILLSMASLFVLLTVIVSGMNIINYNAVVREADEILSLLSENQGGFPEHGNSSSISDFSGKGPTPFNSSSLPPNMSPETPYESRYFSVLVSSKHDLVLTETSRIASVDTDKAIEYAMEVLNRNHQRGFIDDFRFCINTEGENVRITFLDCGRKINAFYNFLTASISMALAGYIVFFLVICFFAGKITQPIAESYEKQKRFIADAGHEIKTPLTIINTNVDLLEMDTPDNESLSDIRQQTKRLTDLTNDLVYLARMEEENTKPPMVEFPVSDVVLETAAPFRTLAESQGKELIFNIEPMLQITGNEQAISQLISILLDNALKYSPAGEPITLNMKRQNKNLILSVVNTTEAEVAKEDLPHVFDRFYRSDRSRNSETGGHGIGLSIAKAIVTTHGGKIEALSHDSHSFRITITLPI